MSDQAIESGKSSQTKITVGGLAIGFSGGAATASVVTLLTTPPEWALPMIARMTEELSIMSIVLLLFAIVLWWERMSSAREWRRAAAKQTDAVSAVAVATEQFANTSTSMHHAIIQMHDQVATNGRHMQRLADILDLTNSRLCSLEQSSRGGWTHGDH